MPHLHRIRLALTVLFVVVVGAPVDAFAQASDAPEAVSAPAPDAASPAEPAAATPDEVADLQDQLEAEREALRREREALQRERKALEQERKASRPPAPPPAPVDDTDEARAKPATTSNVVDRAIVAAFWTSLGHLGGVLLALPAAVGAGVGVFALTPFYTLPGVAAFTLTLFAAPLLGNVAGAYFANNDLKGWRVLAPIALSTVLHYVALAPGIVVSAVMFGPLMTSTGTFSGVTQLIGFVGFGAGLVFSVPLAVAGSALGAGLGRAIVDDGDLQE